MALTFYNGSGSPFAWKVWLALEHKGIPYEMKLLSFKDKDHKKPDFLAVNPRGKLPAIVDDGFALWESTAIVEYLEDRYPQNPLLPGGPNTRALARRITFEVENYLYPPARKMFFQTIFNISGTSDPQLIDEGMLAVRDELARLSSSLVGDFFVGPVSIADFTAFPHLRMLLRMEEKFPAYPTSQLFSPKLKAWVKRVESLPYYEKTIPPHWKA